MQFRLPMPDVEPGVLNACLRFGWPGQVEKAALKEITSGNFRARHADARPCTKLPVAGPVRRENSTLKRLPADAEPG
jgi:hypothetical protein